MGDLPFRRLILYSALSAVVIGIAGFLACLATGSTLVAFFVTIPIVAIALFFILRWWLAKAKAAGVTTDWNYPGTIPRMACFFAIMAVCIWIEYLVFARTGSRLAEFLPVLIFAVPAALVLLRWTWSAVPAPKITDMKVLRFGYYVSLATMPIFGLNLWLQLTERHVYTGTQGLHNFNIATYMLLLANLPISAYYQRKRYLQAAFRQSGLPA